MKATFKAPRGRNLAEVIGRAEFVAEGEADMARLKQLEAWFLNWNLVVATPMQIITGPDSIKRLQEAIEGEFDGLDCTVDQAKVILTYIATGMHISDLPPETPK